MLRQTDRWTDTGMVTSWSQIASSRWPDARQLQRPPGRCLFTPHSEPSLGGTITNMCSRSASGCAVYSWRALASNPNEGTCCSEFRPWHFLPGIGRLSFPSAGQSNFFFFFLFLDRLDFFSSQAFHCISYFAWNVCTHSVPRIQNIKPSSSLNQPHPPPSRLTTQRNGKSLRRPAEFNLSGATTVLLRRGY